MATVVVNIRKEPYDVYCGRGGPFGNKYHRGTREQNIRNHRADLQVDLAFQARVIAELKDKRLGCFCKPKACHCDTYAELCDTGVLY